MSSNARKYQWRQGVARKRELCPRPLTIVVMRVAIVAMHRSAPLLLALFLAGCTTNATRIERLAGTLGMTRSVLEAGGFRSLVFMRACRRPRMRRWRSSSRAMACPGAAACEPSLDPTTGNPLALKLLAQTPPPAAYVTRPCYQEMTGPRCTPERWTMRALFRRDRVEHD